MRIHRILGFTHYKAAFTDLLPIPQNCELQLIKPEKMTFSRPASHGKIWVSAWPKAKNAAFNPYQKLLYSAIDNSNDAYTTEFTLSTLFKRRTPDILHIHWPDVFLAVGVGWRFWLRYLVLRTLLLVARLRQVSLVWTMHNLRRDGQRNSERMDRYFWPWFTDRVDGVIFMTLASRTSAIALFPVLAKKPYAVIPHGHYRPILPSYSDVNVASTTPHILFFGTITRYKNVYRLLESFLEIPDGTAHLSILGKMSSSEPDDRLLSIMSRTQASKCSHITYEDRFLSETQLVDAIKQADLIVFPYSDVLNSGAALFALSVGRPILASDNSLFRELQSQVGSEWIMLIDGELNAGQLCSALRCACEMKVLNKTPNLTVFEWERIAKVTVAFYDKVVDVKMEARA